MRSCFKERNLTSENSIWVLPSSKMTKNRCVKGAVAICLRICGDPPASTSLALDTDVTTTPIRVSLLVVRGVSLNFREDVDIKLYMCVWSQSFGQAGLKGRPCLRIWNQNTWIPNTGLVLLLYLPFTRRLARPRSSKKHSRNWTVLDKWLRFILALTEIVSGSLQASHPMCLSVALLG